MSRLVYSTRGGNTWRRRPVKRRATTLRKKRASPPIPRARFKNWRWRFFKTALILFFITLAGGGVFLTFAIASISRNLPEPGKLLERTTPISTKIYDREGKVLLYDVHDEVRRTPIALSNIPPIAKWAAIIAEDRNFYKHEGFDLKAMLRALLVNITKFGRAQGGSTITQQFIKNAVLTREKTLNRKLKELVLAYQIEKRFSKDEILNMYFNEIPYGSTIYGIEAASEAFFNKPARDLNLVESAVLAALPKAPTRLSPYGNHTDELAARVRYIINGLAEEGYISREQAQLAQAEDILKRIQSRRDNILAPHFVLYVRELLVEKYGEQFVEQGGLKVITTLDWRLQQIAEEEVRKGAERNEKQYNGKNAALVAEDPKTGQILAMVGSRDYFDETVDGNVNVTLRPRQPGSSFKPIVYAAAFEKGFTPDTLLYDVVTIFKAQPKDYTPHNYDNKEHGLISLRSALAGSLNIPAVKTIYLTGIDQVLNLADKLGYTTLRDRSRFGLSIVLGGGEVKLLEHVGAFATLAGSGRRSNQSVILRIEDSSGRVLEQWQSRRPEQVLPEGIANEVTSILSDNSARTFIFGAQSPLILSDRPVAAKTGTTNDWHDGWALGYTPSLAAGVWVGNNDNKEMRRGADGVLVAAPIWNAFMSRALKNTPVEQFPAPEPRPVSNPILRGQGMGQIRARVDRASGKLATALTPAELIEERTYSAPHSILYYLNKDDLNAPPPVNPAEDPNFENWEAAVRQWAERNTVNLETPPTTYDDLHTEANRPTISFLRPTNSATTITGASLDIEVQASAPRGVSRVEILLDGIVKANLQSTPYTTTLSLSEIPAGEHTLTARAYDDIFNHGEVSMQVRVVK